MASVAAAGPLDPPAGPIAPTPGPEPRIAVNTVNTPGDGTSLFRITQPGSYYLAGNITGESGKRGITIASDGVTLDLNGFDLAGVAGSFQGILVAGDGVSIRNGTIRNWGIEGVNLHSNTSDFCVLTDLRAISNVGDGITAGISCVIRNCTSAMNGGDGFQAGNNVTISGCTAHSNTARGYSLSVHANVSHCNASSNGTEGISAAAGGSITACSVQSSGTVGIDTGGNCTVTECTVTTSGLDGIQVGAGCTVQRCAVATSTGDGIQATDDCLIIANNCDGNGNGVGDGAGVHTTGSDNRVEGNNCTDNDRGVDMDASGNFITRNACSGNATNYTVVVGNVCLVANGLTNGVTINGSSGGVAPGSTDPNANFSY